MSLHREFSDSETKSDDIPQQSIEILTQNEYRREGHDQCNTEGQELKILPSTPNSNDLNNMNHPQSLWVEPKTHHIPNLYQL